MVDAMWRGEDPESLCATQVVAMAREECLGVNVAIFLIIKDELLIAE